MEAKTNEKAGLNAIQYPGSSKRGYFFHADEDFREDWDWKKDKSEESEISVQQGNSHDQIAIF